MVPTWPESACADASESEKTLATQSEADPKVVSDTPIETNVAVAVGA